MDFHLDAMIDEIEKNIPDIKAIYLFGSFVSGTANQDSDIDIALLMPKKLLFEHKLQLVLILSDIAHRDVDLVELRYVNTIFQEEILKTAQRIAIYDPLFCEQYEDYIFCSAMDFRDFRKPLVEDIRRRGSVYG
jgi:predicted nucleotidyltransferase